MWKRPAQKFSDTAQMGNDANLSATLPKARNTVEEREKFGTLEQEKKGREMVKEWLTEGTLLWKLAQEF